MNVYGYSPRESQKCFFNSKARFLIGDMGRRWGKTLTGLNWLLEGACKEPGSVSWWLAPIYSQSKMAYRKLLSAAHKGNGTSAIKHKSDSELRIQFLNDSVIEYKSADNPDNLRGEGLKRVVIDEAARVKREVFEDVIRPATSDTAGRVLFISTPKGKNWFFDMWSRGQDPLQKPYESWKMPTSDNPKVPLEDIEQARQSLPIDVFKQEYLAEFLDDAAGVFRNVKACVGAVPSGPVSGMEYHMGVDLARLTDFTTVFVMDENGVMVYMDRFNQIDWKIQKERIKSVCEKYNNSHLILDSTGVGDPIFEDLRKDGLNVEGYKFTSESKRQLIQCLMLSFEQEKIKIFNDPVLLNEVGIFEYQMLPSGVVRYAAPQGYHDDCVIGLALANWGVCQEVGGGFAIPKVGVRDIWA